MTGRGWMAPGVPVAAPPGPVAIPVPLPPEGVPVPVLLTPALFPLPVPGGADASAAHPTPSDDIARSRAPIEVRHDGLVLCEIIFASIVSYQRTLLYSFVERNN